MALPLYDMFRPLGRLADQAPSHTPIARTSRPDATSPRSGHAAARRGEVTS
jgi:hypothetical protein